MLVRRQDESVVRIEIGHAAEIFPVTRLMIGICCGEESRLLDFDVNARLSAAAK